MDSGIYIIKNVANGKVYIGQSRHLANRHYSHFHALELGKHFNKHLQRSYDYYGAESFMFSVLEECEIDDLDEREKYWIARYDSMNVDKGYNNEGGGNVGKEVSERTREAKRGKNNPNFGKHASAETRLKQRMSSIGKNSPLTAEQVYEMKEEMLNGARDNDLAKKYGLTKSAVGKIRSCKNWDHVHSDINDELRFLNEDEKIYRNRAIRALNAIHTPRKKIAELVGCNQCTVARVLGTKVVAFEKTKEGKELQKKVVAEFLAGVDREEIKKKYGIADWLYVRLISEAYNKQMDEYKAKAIEMRNNGMMVKDIAKELGFARNTITKWTLASCKPRDNSDN